MVEKLNKYSQRVTQDPTTCSTGNAPCYGLTDDDFQKAFIGIASTGYEGNPAICTLTVWLQN